MRESIWVMAERVVEHIALANEHAREADIHVENGRRIIAETRS